MDITDNGAVRHVISDFKPDHIYHLAACHHSSERSRAIELDTEMVAVNFRATELLLSTIARVRPKCRILFAGSSQMYSAPAGHSLLVNEDTPMNPVSFYGYTKSWGRELFAHYRDKRGIFASTAILFNHESPMRRPDFLSRKISIAAARAKLGGTPKLHLLDISRRTDWSSAEDVVEGMRLALSAQVPVDYVFASGMARGVDDALEIAFSSVGLNWKEFATFDHPDKGTGGVLAGDATRARNALGWRPSISFPQMLSAMVASDISSISAGEIPLN